MEKGFTAIWYLITFPALPLSIWEKSYEELKVKKHVHIQPVLSNSLQFCHTDVSYLVISLSLSPSSCPVLTVFFAEHNPKYPPKITFVTSIVSKSHKSGDGSRKG